MFDICDDVIIDEHKVQMLQDKLQVDIGIKSKARRGCTSVLIKSKVIN